MSEPVYPVIDVYPTIQAEGNLAGGEPIVLVRLGTPPGWHHAHISSLRPTRSNPILLSELVSYIQGFSRTATVHLTGDDPCLSPIVPLIGRLLGESFKVSVGTCGAFLLPQRLLEDKAHLDITLSPKPGIPLHWEMLQAATEIRLYVKKEQEDDEFADLRAHLRFEYRTKLLYVPFTMDLGTIHRTMVEVQQDRTKFHLPLYRLMPDFDREFQSAPDAADVFTLQDR